MAKSPLDAAQFTKDIQALAKTLTKRAEAFQRLVVSNLADAALEQVRARAPSTKDVPEDYKRLLEVVKVDGRDASYAIVYRGKPSEVADYDPATTVLYIKILDHRDNSKEAVLFRALSRYHPYTLDTMPLDIPRSTAFVVARTVTKAETDIIRKKAERQKNDIAKVISKLGAGVTTTAAFNANTSLLFNDMAFQVLRTEFGIGMSSKAHWRPALRFVAESDSLLKKMMTSDESAKLWNDPADKGYEKSGIVKDNVSEASVGDLDDFQKQLLPNGDL